MRLFIFVLFLSSIAHAQIKPNPVNSPLFNYTLLTSSDIGVSDTIVTAFGKLQAQSNAVSSTLLGKANLVGGNTFTGNQRVEAATFTLFNGANPQLVLAASGGAGNSPSLEFKPFEPRTGGSSSRIVAVDNTFSSDLVFYNAATGDPANVATEKMRLLADGGLVVQNPNTTTFTNVGQFLTPNLAVNSNSVLKLGRTDTQNNASELRFFYDNDNSNFNRLNFGWVLGSVTASMLVNGQTGFGTETPTASAKVQIDSTTQGFLPPRMTSAQRDAIATPAQGVEVYDTTLNTKAIYNGSAWLFEHKDFTTGNQSSTSTTYADVTELVTPTLPVGRYVVRFVGTLQSTSTLEGCGLRFFTPATNVTIANWRFSQAANGTDKNYEYSQLSTATNVTATGVLTANADYPASGEGIMQLSTAETISIQIRTETGFGANCSVRANSILIVERVSQ